MHSLYNINYNRHYVSLSLMRHLLVKQVARLSFEDKLYVNLLKYQAGCDFLIGVVVCYCTVSANKLLIANNIGLHV